MGYRYILYIDIFFSTYFQVEYQGYMGYRYMLYIVIFFSTYFQLSSNMSEIQGYRGYWGIQGRGKRFSR